MLLLISAASAGTGWTVMMPFGIGAFVHNKPVAGVVYALTQTAGLSVLTVGTIQGDRAFLNEDLAAGERWRFITGGGATFAVASYFISMVHASRLHDMLESEDRAASGARWVREQQAWQQPVALTVEGPVWASSGIAGAAEMPWRLDGVSISLLR
jgi:hypothetical protein